MTARNLPDRHRWLGRGAAAFAQAFPEAKQHLGPDAPPHYVCPECPEPDESGAQYRAHLFPRSPVESVELTAEHVPFAIGLNFDGIGNASADPNTRPSVFLSGQCDPIQATVDSAIFADCFESGNTSEWSSTTP